MSDLLTEDELRAIEERDVACDGMVLPPDSVPDRRALLRHVRASDTFLEKACEGFDEVSSGYLRERDESRAELQRLRETGLAVRAILEGANMPHEERVERALALLTRDALTPAAAQKQEEP